MESIQELGFEGAMERLQALLERLQDEKTPLYESCEVTGTVHAEAAELIARCQETLEQARLQIETIDLSLAARGMGEA